MKHLVKWILSQAGRWRPDQQDYTRIGLDTKQKQINDFGIKDPLEDTDGKRVLL